MKSKNQAKGKKAPLANAKASTGAPKTGTPQPSTTKAKWVRVTVEDVLQSCPPELRKTVESWSEALSCPENETAELTPEQKEWRQQYIAERWPLYHAVEKRLREAGEEAQSIQAMDAIHGFGMQAAWFAENTPHPFKVSHASRISSFAGVSCRYMQRMALHGNHHAIADLARLTVEMVETLTDLLTGNPDKVEANAKLMRRLTGRLPYWPMLQFRHAAANNHFQRVADLLELGKNCVINVAEQANYSLQTPINRFVWRCLKHFDEVHWIIRGSLESGEKNQTAADIQAAGERAIHVLELVAAGKFNINPESQPSDPIEKALEPYVFTDAQGDRFGMIHREEIPIYQVSFKLDPLTKGNAPLWADSAIMPYVRKRFPDLRMIEELSYLKAKVGKTGKRYAPVRKAVIQALEQLARNP